MDYDILLELLKDKLCDVIARDRVGAGARKPRLSVQCSVCQCVSCSVWLDRYSS